MTTAGNKKALGFAIAATLLADRADAATVSLNLLEVRQHVKASFSPGNITSSTATWSYDDVTGVLSQTGGTFNVRFTIVPTTTLFRHFSTGLVVGNGAAASATTFSCTDGNFGSGVGASLCGNYNFGANFTNESTVTWGPGTAASRTMGGDDGALGPQQTVAVYDAFQTINWDGNTLIIGNAFCNPAAPGSAGCQGQPYPNNANDGYSFVLSNVPLPAAAWLIAPAFGLLGPWVKRRKATA